MSALAELARYRMTGVNETELLALLERARVVGVLDAWYLKQIGPECSGWEGPIPSPEMNDSGQWFLLGHFADSPDAARAAAAKAIESGEV